MPSISNTTSWSSLEQALAVFRQASTVDRHRFLLSLIQDHCKPSELSLMHCQIQSSSYLKIDFIAELPEELAVQTLSYLDGDPLALSRVALVSKRWNRIIQDNQLWRTLCRRQQYDPFPSVTSAETTPLAGPSPTLKRRKTASSSSASASTQTSSSWRHATHPRLIIGSTPSLAKLNAPWKRTFIQNYITHRNWSTGRCHVKAVEHSLGSLEDAMCLAIDESLDAAFSIRTSQPREGGSLWCTRSGRSTLSLRGHEGAISAVRFSRRRIVTGGVDRTVRVWDREQGGLCTMVLSGHEGEVECVRFNEDVIVSGAADETIRIWSMQNGRQLNILQGHSASVTCVDLDNEFVYSGSCDMTLRVWSRTTGACLRVLVGHTDHISTLEAKNGKLVSGSADRTIKIWNPQTGQCVRTLEGHHANVVCLQLDDHKIVSGSADQTIKVWSLESGQLWYTLSRHAGPIWSLRFNRSKLISTSFDRSVLVWDFSSVSPVAADEYTEGQSQREM